MRMAAQILGVAFGLLTTAPHVAHAHGPARDRIAALTTTIAREPANVDLVIQRASLHREMGQLDCALADFERASRLDPTRDVVHLGRALTLRDLGDFSAALSVIDTFLARQPGHAIAWSVRARSLSGLHRIPEAVGSLDRAIALADPPTPEDYVFRAKLLASTGSARLDEAIAGLDEGLSRLGPAVSLELLAVELERERGAYDAALARLDAMQSRWDRAETLLAMRGDVLTDAGREREAEAAYTDALQAIDEREARGRATPATSRLREALVVKLANGRDD